MSGKEPLIEQWARRLLASPPDYLPEYGEIVASRKSTAPRFAAGVLLPLLLPSVPSRETTDWHRIVFPLIKRSSLVAQPGDLSCPGGMLHPLLDRCLSLPFLLGPLARPFLRAAAQGWTPVERRIITLFWTNALRESWEEIGLSPFHVRFLGPLPTYRLELFRRTIFPMAGIIEVPWRPKPNREVDRIVVIPLSHFLDPCRFGRLRLTIPDPSSHKDACIREHPCLILNSSEGNPEILWGATLTIIVHFLSIVMDYDLPQWQKNRTIERRLRPDYMTGRADS